MDGLKGRTFTGSLAVGVAICAPVRLPLWGLTEVAPQTKCHLDQIWRPIYSLDHELPPVRAQRWRDRIALRTRLEVTGPASGFIANAVLVGLPFV